MNQPPIIGIVGICGSGKSTLINNLLRVGIPSRHIAQEHSYVPDMWLRLTHPDFLICLDVSYESSKTRKNLSWSIEEYDEQVKRTQNAREHADLIVDTDQHTPEETLTIVIESLQNAGIIN